MKLHLLANGPRKRIFHSKEKNCAESIPQRFSCHRGPVVWAIIHSFPTKSLCNRGYSDLEISTGDVSKAKTIIKLVNDSWPGLMTSQWRYYRAIKIKTWHQDECERHFPYREWTTNEAILSQFISFKEKWILI